MSHEVSKNKIILSTSRNYKSTTKTAFSKTSACKYQFGISFNLRGWNEICVGYKIHFQQQMRNQSSPYARPNLIHAKPAITQKYEDLVGVIEELGKDVRPTYAGSKR